jgi:hypothetical protein
MLMILDPRDAAIRKLTDTIQVSVAKHLASVLPKVIGEAFDAGGMEYAAALQRAMGAIAIPNIALPEPRPAAIQEGSLGETSKDGRAPRGSVRKAVVAAISPHPQGVPAVELVARALEIDPSISTGGIYNELNRQKGKIYVNEDGRWRLVPGLKLGGDYYQFNQNPKEDEATGPS